MNDKQSKCENDGGIAGHNENSAPGLNDNLEFMGKQLHVQTERIGLPAPHIVTQVFSNGRVVFSRKNEIPLQGSGPEEFAIVRELMRAQHLQTIREIRDKQRRILDRPQHPETK